MNDGISKKLIGLLTGMFLLLFNVMAQEQAQYFAPVVSPSPTVSSLGSYGNIETEKATGAPSIDVPLYNLKVRNNYSIDFSLHYSRNGIRVDEIAGTAGTGWAFNGMFAIYRVVLDDPDELSYDWTKKLDNGFNADSLNNLIDMGMSGGFDLQPDLFTLVAPGFTGRFYLSGDSGIFINQNTSYKIKRIPVYGFKVTDGQGNVHWFGGDFIERSRVKIACPGQFSFPDNAIYPTAWFLNNIITPYKDTILFGYTPLSHDYFTSVYKTKVTSWKELEYIPSCRCSGMADQECNALTYTSTYRLNYIISKNIKVTFSDISRKDNLSDKLFGQMAVYNSTSTKDSMLKRIAFEYQYGQNKQRPYLSAVKQFDFNKSDSLFYSMSYLNVDQLPDLLNNQTDNWGYFNANSNNKEVNTTVSFYGMLNKIVYPTGGYDSIVYETNMVYEQSKIPVQITLASLQGTGLGDHSIKQYVVYKTIYKTSGDVRWSGQCQWLSSAGPDPTMHKMDVQIRNASTDALYNSTTVTAGSILPYTEIPTAGMFSFGQDSILLKFILNVYGEDVRGEVAINQIAYRDTMINKVYGGVRVKKIITNSTSAKPQVKTYNYNYFLNPNASSGYRNVFPEVDEDLYTKIICAGDLGGPGGNIGGSAVCNYKFHYEKSQVNLFSYGNTPLFYANVTEGFGENMEGGAVRYEYDLRLPGPAIPVYSAETGAYTSGPGLVAAPYTLNREATAAEKTKFFLKNVGGNLKVIKRRDIIYNWSSFVARKGYTVRQRVFISGADASPHLLYTRFDVNRYELNSSFFATKTVVDSTFNDDGSSMTNSSSYFYDYLPQNVNVSRIEELTSKRDTATQYFSYAGSFKGQAVYDSMVQRNILNKAIEFKQALGSKPIALKKMNYTLNQGVILLDNLQEQLGTYPIREIVKYHNYDVYGNLRDRSETNNIHEIYLWGYLSQHPVAKVVGSTIGVVQALASQALLDNAYNYTDLQVRTELQKIRSGLANTNAKVFTYTYNFLGNVTSETDAAGRTIFYEYDGFGRLCVVRDQNNNILKRIVYKFRSSN